MKTQNYAVLIRAGDEAQQLSYRWVAENGYSQASRAVALVAMFMAIQYAKAAGAAPGATRSQVEIAAILRAEAEVGCQCVADMMNHYKLPDDIPGLLEAAKAKACAALAAALEVAGRYPGALAPGREYLNEAADLKSTAQKLVEDQE